MDEGVSIRMPIYAGNLIAKNVEVKKPAASLVRPESKTIWIFVMRLKRQ
ncbi:MAG: hypothetical protein ABI144_01105 [Gallionella sp.]